MANIVKGLTNDEKNKVQDFLDRIRSYLISHDYQIKPNEKNKEFDRFYNLRDYEKQRIMQSLTVDDCIKIDKNNNPNYEDSDIYVFLKEASIYVYGEESSVELYIKMYLLDCKSYEQVIVISFHKSCEYEY